jgi:RNA polymerase sigma factor FliA
MRPALEDGLPANERTRALWDHFAASHHPDLRDRLIECYLPFARAAAARLYRVRSDESVPFDDYLQYARIGLVEAIDRYDPAREASFETFSSYRIRGAILNGLGHETELAAQREYWRSRHQDRMESLRPASLEGSGEADLEEVAQLTVELALGLVLEQQGEEVADESLHANPYAATELAQLRRVTCAMVEKLPPRERQVVESHYFRQKEFQLIARELGVTKGRVSQVHAQALVRIRKLISGPDLDRSL